MKIKEAAIFGVVFVLACVALIRFGEAPPDRRDPAFVPGPNVLTYRQIVEAVPGASSDFALHEWESLATDVETVKRNWELWKAREAAKAKRDRYWFW